LRDNTRFLIRPTQSQGGRQVFENDIAGADFFGVIGY
jgi:hypothetical protein